METVESFTILDLSSKWSSKTELYNMLTRESKVYLHSKQDTTQSFLWEILMGKRNIWVKRMLRLLKYLNTKG